MSLWREQHGCGPLRVLKGGLFRKPEKVKDNLFIHNSCLCLNTCRLQNTGRRWLEYQVARVYNCLSNGNSPLININGSSIHTSHREQTPKSWSAASLEANQMLSVLSNRSGWADSRSRTATRFSANFKCGGEAGTERSPGKRILWLNHRVKISTGGWSNSMKLPAT